MDHNQAGTQLNTTPIYVKYSAGLTFNRTRM